MDQFAACYFCGAAVDTSLSERPVIPPSMAGSDAAAETLSLCSTCERKLDAIVERVLETVDAADTASPTGAGAGSPGGQGGPARSTGDQAVPGERDDAAGGRSPEDRQTRESGRSNRSQAADGPGDDRQADPPADEPASAGTADDDRQTVSRLENSKVMRMLENRDFPVEREPFEHVVANAYDVTPQDVSRVIDMAIDRGLVADREGDLVKPD